MFTCSSQQSFSYTYSGFLLTNNFNIFPRPHDLTCWWYNQQIHFDIAVYMSPSLIEVKDSWTTVWNKREVHLSLYNIVSNLPTKWYCGSDHVLLSTSMIQYISLNPSYIPLIQTENAYILYFRMSLLFCQLLLWSVCQSWVPLPWDLPWALDICPSRNSSLVITGAAPILEHTITWGIYGLLRITTVILLNKWLFKSLHFMFVR